ncbi:hypothetical protein ACJQWK_01957 [Exserohilum turcicum]
MAGTALGRIANGSLVIAFGGRGTDTTPHASHLHANGHLVISLGPCRGSRSLSSTSTWHAVKRSECFISYLSHPNFAKLHGPVCAFISPSVRGLADSGVVVYHACLLPQQLWLLPCVAAVRRAANGLTRVQHKIGERERERERARRKKKEERRKKSVTM